MGGSVVVEATFNRPGLGNDTSTRVEDRIVEMIGQAAPGSDIYVSIYTFKRAAIAEALLNAQQQDVTVQVLVDNKSLRSEAMALLRNGDSTRPPLQGCRGGRCIKVCRAGCHGFHINHNKFVLFSELRDGSRWVVAQTSANFTRGQLRHYNDLLVVKNDPRLYEAFRGYFDDLSRRRWSPRYYRREQGDSGIGVHFFPRLFGPDPLVHILSDIECDGDSVIRVAHSRFESYRVKVARRLRQLSDRGCDVHIILREEPGKRSPGKAVMRELEGLVTLLPYKGDASGPTHNAIHTKLMLINAPYAGSEARKHLVLTGSHNLSVTSLRLNDEVLLRVDNETLFDAYEAFWDEILSNHEAR
jgi:phosphatidylserine/phosphatidylglycerophosphate/cardiolipin synthase-like enzyme